MFCPKCGKEVEEDAKFCKHCGYEFVEEKEEVKKTGWKDYLGLGVLGIFCIILGFLIGGNVGNFIYCFGLGAFIFAIIIPIINGVYHLIKK